ncbi:unnamed protein product [Linum tenue]|uniref:ubiquitinyl hydrolase 1 n=1 Tax=Linum tenue TaxID=586396 RepID=A0AAV0LPV3_9ROSI|nr:unnamed protein product [Linum tenue]
MGKKVKKKSRAPQKEKRVAGHSLSKVPQQSSLSISDGNVAGDGVVVVRKERNPCAHLDKGFDLTKFSDKISGSDSISCEDCREAVADRRGGKGKGKHGKKKGADSKSDSKAIWVCLNCGHYGCGGVGLPTIAQSHAVRHARQAGHPLVIQWENSHLRWCFQCDSFIPVDKTEDSGESKDVFSDAVKVIKAHVSHPPTLRHGEDIWLGSGSILSEVKAEGTISKTSEGNGGYTVRGLVNLGNTCFFNSIMQNLLAMNRLRSYFVSADSSFGPLSTALRKLYDETRQVTGARNVINPRSFFGSLCCKAPQFRGYQQHDSHELLRCLLDGWSTEELAGRRQINASDPTGVAPTNIPTFVDATFGGQISSTVCCIECGHSSTIYEPYLDLSLPVPTKKPPTKKFQAVSRAKKTKLPPKRVGKARQKVSKDTADTVQGVSAATSSTSIVLGCQPLLITSNTDNVVSSSGDTTVSDSAGQTSDCCETGLVAGNFLEVPVSVDKEVVGAELEGSAASAEPYSWMDFISSETSNENDLISQVNELSIIEVSADKDVVSNGKEETPPFDLVHQTPPYSEPKSVSIDPWEEEVPLQVQSSEVLLLPYYEEGAIGGEDTISGEAGASSSSIVGSGQDEAAFDGFGDLFNEPEVFIGPVAGPVHLSNGVAGETCPTAVGISSESDPDEVDDSDSPVSVESCLTQFIKAEVLCNDNAWECENCSETLHLQNLEAKKKLGRTVSGGDLNGGDSRRLNSDISCSSGSGIVNGEAIAADTLVNPKDENLVSNGGEIECLNENVMAVAENGQVDMQKLLVSPIAEQRCGTAAAPRSVLPPSPGGGEEPANEEGANGNSSVNTFGIDESVSTSAEYAAGSAGNEENGLKLPRKVESEDSEGKEQKTIKKAIVKRDATKRVLIDKVPPLLTIHLKRFSQDIRGRLSKLSGHVSFRDTLDLRPYMNPRCEKEDEEKTSSVYRLTGVVEHMGTMRGGHYVAYVRGRERSKKQVGGDENGGGGGDGDWVWYYASDGHVKEVSLDEVLRCEAYILFYERV